MALVVLGAGPLAAQEVDCANAMSQQEMNFCAMAEFEAADADLNAAYKGAVAAMRAIDADLPQDEQGAEASLRAAQRAWITFRDAACAAEGYVMHGGSAEPLLVYGCKAMLTQQRAEGLWGLAEGY